MKPSKFKFMDGPNMEFSVEYISTLKLRSQISWTIMSFEVRLALRISSPHYAL